MRHNNLYNCSNMSYCVVIFILYTFVEFKDKNATVNRFSVVVKSITTESATGKYLLSIPQRTFQKDGAVKLVIIFFRRNADVSEYFLYAHTAPECVTAFTVPVYSFLVKNCINIVLGSAGIELFKNPVISFT